MENQRNRQQICIRYESTKISISNLIDKKVVRCFKYQEKNIYTSYSKFDKNHLFYSWALIKIDTNTVSEIYTHVLLSHRY